jgi:hypothetical protein
MALGGVIEGRVEDTEGRPVPFADVYPVAVDADDWDLPELTAGGAPDLLPRRVAKRRDLRGRAVPQAPARTTGEGLFVKAGLEPGVYALVADAVGFEPLLTTGVTTGQSEVRLTLQRESLIVLSAVDRATGRSVPIDEARAFRCSGRDDPWRPGRPESTQVPVLLGAEDGIGGMLGVLWKDWRSV